MKPFHFQHSTQGEVDILSLEGYMDIAALPKFEHAVEELIHEQRIRIVLDFSRLDYISSAGLGAVISWVHQVRQEGGDIKIGGHSPGVYDTLNTFGFTSVFEIFSTPDQAIAQFGK